ncbi:MAG: FAD-dependent oxidoreductase [Bacillota bacterium]|nr:FAD-dependent oxidoreductase [Bacillota bacterium]
MLDMAIIGSGVAGLTAGLYGARAGLETVIFEQLLPGGQAATIMHLENYPGFVNGVDGVSIMNDMMEQATNAGAGLRYDGIQGLQPGAAGQPHLLLGPEGPIEARSIIIATGANPRKLGLPREEELTGRGVCYCASCDGALFRNKVVAVNGGGDTALTDALVLANYAKEVLLIHRREEFRGSPLLQKRVRENEKIKLFLSRTVQELRGENRLEQLLLKKTDGSTELIESDALFVAVGIQPNTEAFRGILELDEMGCIRTQRDLSTNIPGIYAAGDCRDTLLRQVVTGAADGALAATMAAAYLLSQGK